MIRRLRHLDDSADVGDGLALGDQLLGSFELADDLLRHVPGVNYVGGRLSNRRRTFRLRSFPRLTPMASPGLRLEHCVVETCVSKKALQAGVFLLELLEAFGLCGFHTAVQLLPAVIGRG